MEDEEWRDDTPIPYEDVWVRIDRFHLPEMKSLKTHRYIGEAYWDGRLWRVWDDTTQKTFLLSSAVVLWKPK